MSRRLLLSAAAALVVASGCGGSAGGSTTPSPAAAAAPTIACASIDPHNAFGQTVCITPDGIRPQWLVSTVGQPVTWRNETDATVKVVFDAVDAGPGTVEPGATWVWMPPNPESASYHVIGARRMRGVVEADPPSP